MAGTERSPVGSSTTDILSKEEKREISGRLMKLREVVFQKLYQGKELQESLGPDPVRSRIITKIIEQKRISRPQAVLLFKKELRDRLKEIDEVSDEIIEAAEPGGLEKLVRGEFPNLSEVWTGDAYDGIDELAGLDEYIKQLSSIIITEESIVSTIIRG